MVAVTSTMFSSLAHAQAAPPQTISIDIDLKVVGSLSKTLKEASGLEVTESGMLWTHNDDRLPVLYGLDSAGNVVKAIHLNHKNKGWEDLTLDQQGNIYIGAFGNNNNERRDLSILKLSNPDEINETIVNAETIDFVYSDQISFPPSEAQRNFDADALLSAGDSLYIFSKNRTEPFTGYTKVYRLPNTPGKYEALLYDSIFVGNGAMMQHWVTSADLSPDGKWLALLSHDRMWLVTDFENKRFSSGKIFEISLEHFSHKTGVCFASDSQLFLVDELELGLIGGKLYGLDLTAVLTLIAEQKGTQQPK